MSKQRPRLHALLLPSQPPRGQCSDRTPTSPLISGGWFFPVSSPCLTSASPCAGDIPQSQCSSLRSQHACLHSCDDPSVNFMPPSPSTPRVFSVLPSPHSQASMFLSLTMPYPWLHKRLHSSAGIIPPAPHLMMLNPPYIRGRWGVDECWV